MDWTLQDRNNIIQDIYLHEEPKNYVINGLSLALNKHTLVPHPDTFILIEKAIEYLKKHPDITTIADIGTGSGFVAINIARAFPNRTVYASDTSEKALKLANQNAHTNNVKVTFFHNTDTIWLSEFKKNPIDFIISNPPFVGTKEYFSDSFIQNFPEVKKEPESAIVTNDEEGVEPYIQMLKNGNHLKVKTFLFQCNSLHIATVKKIAIEHNPQVQITSFRDSNTIERFLLLEKL